MLMYFAVLAGRTVLWWMSCWLHLTTTAAAPAGNNVTVTNSVPTMSSQTTTAPTSSAVANVTQTTRASTSAVVTSGKRYRISRDNYPSRCVIALSYRISIDFYRTPPKGLLSGAQAAVSVENGEHGKIITRERELRSA